MKLALQYWDARGMPTKRRFVARERSYHGNTWARFPCQASWSAGAVQGSLLDVSFVSAANAYRPLGGCPHLSSRLLWLMNSMHGSKRSAHSMSRRSCSSQSWGRGGVVPAPPGYAKAIRAVVTGITSS